MCARGIGRSELMSSAFILICVIPALAIRSMLPCRKPIKKKTKTIYMYTLANKQILNGGIENDIESITFLIKKVTVK